MLPWHAEIWRQWRTAYREQRWAHALLLHGLPGVGKRELATHLAKTLLCDNPGDTWQACGNCASCALFNAGTHPDLMLLSPAEGKQQIAIDQVRGACSDLALTSYRRGWKVAVVSPAHQLTVAAANCLLKTLEEPAANTAILLLTSRPSALLPTVRSRCQQWGISPPTAADAHRWLAANAKQPVKPELLRLAQGAPLQALAMAESGYAELWSAVGTDLGALLSGDRDVTQIAKGWANTELPERLTCLDHWLSARLRQAIAGTDDPITGAPLPTDARQLNINRLFQCLDRTRELKAQLARTALQAELAVDGILIGLLQALTAGSQARKPPVRF
jgi:DNA polymerase III subunit delta'